MGPALEWRASFALTKRGEPQFREGSKHAVADAAKCYGRTERIFTATNDPRRSFCRFASHAVVCATVKNLIMATSNAKAHADRCWSCLQNSFLATKRPALDLATSAKYASTMSTKQEDFAKNDHLSLPSKRSCVNELKHIKRKTFRWPTNPIWVPSFFTADPKVALPHFPSWAPFSRTKARKKFQQTTLTNVTPLSLCTALSPSFWEPQQQRKSPRPRPLPLNVSIESLPQLPFSSSLRHRPALLVTRKRHLLLALLLF